MADYKELAKGIADKIGAEAPGNYGIAVVILREDGADCVVSAKKKDAEELAETLIKLACDVLKDYTGNDKH